MIKKTLLLLFVMALIVFSLTSCTGFPEEPLTGVKIRICPDCVLG